MHLQPNTTLQGGKYRIERELGHGGFGVTYLAVQVGLDRRVAIKEFFMSEYCNRDADTSHVTIGSEGSRETVERFRNKFIKEAQNIAGLKHPNIISIHDVFEDNGTAYYVMEYLDHGSLADVVKYQGRLAEAEALRYIRQIADALRYIHERKMNHLDVKPGNILIDENNAAVLIDFGLSKRYDDEGNQTSTTPVGISHGYAPLEQYKKSGVDTFSPATDIYSLGATLYKLITGITPPDANDILTDGLPSHPGIMSSSVYAAIEQAMQPNKNKRPQSVEEFLGLLDGKVEEVTELIANVATDIHSPKQSENTINDRRSSSKGKSNMVVWFGVALVCILVGVAIIFLMNKRGLSSSILPSDNLITYMVNGVTLTMVKVEGGTFTMGASDDNEANKDEMPAHQVSLNDFAIGETEVTQELWQAVMGNNPSKFVNNPQHPVEQVSWEDCQEFVNKLNSLTGVKFHLPTEAEWEYAARGGRFTKGYKYSGGDEIETVAWYETNATSTTHAVRGKQPNELGLYDMSGNVWEWCSDLYGSYKSPITAAQTNRVLRGGGWRNDAQGNRITFRLSGKSDKKLYTIGLRLAMSIGEPNTPVVAQSIPVNEVTTVPTATLFYVKTTPSSAIVYIDDKKVGITPIERMEIVRGSHKVKLVKEGYEDKVFTRTFGDEPVIVNESLVKRVEQKEVQALLRTEDKPSLSNTDSDEIYEDVETQPEFPGGMGELMKFLKSNIKYPEICQRQGIQGRVVVQFVVNTDGTIVDPYVVNPVNPYLDKEAIRVLSVMPNWKPATQKGKHVRVRFTLPITFRLDTSSTASKSATTGKINGHEWVDLGLSVKWATCNVGASSPSNYGNYYAWGETSTKSDYTVKTYKYYKYGQYVHIGNNISGTQYDVARVNWGDTWRMPTKEEIDELKEKCSWTWTTQDGCKGYRVLGPNGKSIFLPAAGYRGNTSCNFVGSYGFYWSATPNSNYVAYSLRFLSDYFDWYYGHRCEGHMVRPVSD